MANLISNEFDGSFDQNSKILSFKSIEAPTKGIDISKVAEDFSPLSNKLPDFSNSEICKTSDADIVNQANIQEYGVSEGVVAVKEIFPSDVIQSWDNYSSEQRADILDKFGKKISNALNIEEVSIKFDVSEKGVLGYTSGDGTIHLRQDFVENPNLLIHAIDTIAHEVRHQFQCEAMNNPEKFDIDKGTLNEWIIAGDYYNSTDSYNPLAYQYNPLENDSQDYGRSIVRAFCRDYQELAYGQLINDSILNFA